jgi:hypothetical protein
MIMAGNVGKKGRAELTLPLAVVPAFSELLSQDKD